MYFLYSPIDCIGSPLLQLIWDFVVVPNPHHTYPHPTGKGSWWNNSSIPLVCRFLHHHLLLCFASTGLWSLYGRLAGPRGGSCPHSGCSDLRHHCQHPTEAQTSMASFCSPVLGFPSSMGPLSWTVGQNSHRHCRSLLLLLQVLQF